MRGTTSAIGSFDLNVCDRLTPFDGLADCNVMGKRLPSFVAIMLVAAACADDSGSSGGGVRIGRDSIDDWPLTVESGVVDCEVNSVIFTTDDGTVYAVNGFADGEADAKGWRDITPIWADNPDIE